MNNVMFRSGSVAEALREQVTIAPLDPVQLRMLLDWAADELDERQGRIERLVTQIGAAEASREQVQ